MNTPYLLSFIFEPRLLALEPTAISYSIKKDDEIVSELAMVHEKLSHLIIVSEDLLFFDHVHADFDPATGVFSLNYTFPREGKYILFADFTPTETGITQVERYEIEIKENPAATKEPEDNSSVSGDTFINQEIPDRLVSNEGVRLIYRVRDRKGKPVEDIEPFMGAPGHLVIISKDTQIFIHAHPQIPGEEHMQSEHNQHSHQHHDGQPEYFGPELAFHTQFPSPGSYWVWIEIKRNGLQHRKQFDITIKQ